MNRIAWISIVIVMYTFLSIGCHTDRNIVTEFPRMALIRPCEEYVLPFAPKEYGRVFISGGLLFIHNRRGEEAFNVYRLPDLKTGFTAGIIGRGPNEFLIAPQVIFLTPGDGSLNIYDTPTKRLMRVSFEDGLMKVLAEEELYMPNGVLGNDIRPLRENVYLCKNDNPHAYKEIVLISTDKNTHKMMVDYPEFMQRYASVNNLPVDNVGMGPIITKPDGSRFGIFYFYYKYFRLFDDDGNQIKEVKVNIKPYNAGYSSPKDVSSSASGLSDPFAAINAMYAYDAVFATNDYIYAVCQNNDLKGSEVRSELQVWDWDGNPVALYQFNDAQILSHIDIENMKMYSFRYLDKDQDVGAIRVYDLSGLPH